MSGTPTAPAQRSSTRTRARTVRTAIATVLSAITLFVVSLAPGVIASGSALALARIPLESILALIVLAFVPWRWVRRIVATVVAVVLVLATLTAALDRGFTATVGRPFDVVTGWPELVDGYGVVSDATGSIAAVAILVLVVVATAGLIVAVAASLLHLAAILGRGRRISLIGVSALTAGWVVLALVGAQLVPGEPIAASDSVAAAVAKTDQLGAAARSQAAFDQAAATDAYASQPASKLLTGLKGKDVIVAFIESYGQVAVQNTPFSSGVDAVLRTGNAQLAAKGYSERSAFLTSSTFGGISWLAHSTLQTGLWIDSQQKYDQVTSGIRFTLSDAFRKGGWQTISDVPSDTKTWPVGRSFYHYGSQLNATNVGYAGPKFSYARVPDQYTWSYFQQHELAKPHKPLMAEIDFVSSHTPWTPLPNLVPWASVGDGSIYDPQPAQGLPPSVVWQDPRHVQQVYGQSIEYSMSSLFSFLTTFDDPNLVLVVLGDHQPATEVSGTGANHDVPVSIISKDPAVMDRVSSWKWEPGMLPSAAAPVWRMDAFRDRFLAAYGG
ncbi:CDP-alcohol phosphatidyltransferase [Leifsonia poae]|uniref:CDP-alcohol phosphatidyltransferase n=1 Tax=Leifsonia poae TaxID=110933 RepID=UPI0022F250E7|nr:CDP-alcohol phosphatidyltransferase [Leifsonia poae]